MMKANRRKSRTIKVGNVYIGGGYPIVIQSMTKTKTADIEKTIRQIRGLAGMGCELVRVAVKDSADAKAISKLKNRINIPIVADIHFNWRLALEAIDNGADKIRLNPGNIYRDTQIKEIVSALKLAKIPLRVGVNSGSLKHLNSKRLNMSEKLVASAASYIKKIERLGFYDIVISLKSSNIFDTIAAYRKMAKFCEYPFHLGVTAAGLPLQGAIKSSIAIGALLLEGIGDSIRISLTDKPEEEVKVTKYILESIGLRHFGPEIISCPTCGRCEVDLVKIVRGLENSLVSLTGKQANGSTGSPSLEPSRAKSRDRQMVRQAHRPSNHPERSPGTGKPIKVAVMGCVVNGPGEAREADIAVAFGKREGLLFKKGRPFKKVTYNTCVAELLKEMEKING